MDERGDTNQDEIDCEQEQTEIFLEVHDVSLSLGDDVDLETAFRNVTIKVTLD